MLSVARTVTLVGLAAGLVVVFASAPAEGETTDPEVIQLLERVDDMFRGDSSQGRMTMRVKTKRWEREMVMSVWSEGTERSLVRIESPPKEKGVSTLRVENSIWNYLPKVDRTIKIPASMMGASWMGSHLTNDDLVQSSRYSDDYSCKLESPVDESMWLVACTPDDDAPVIWGRVEIAISKSDTLPRTTRFFDDDGELVRTMSYLDVKSLDGRRLPTRILMEPADAPNEFTEMTYDELELDVELPERLFTLQSLKR